jgi:hypothetical protein
MWSMISAPRPRKPTTTWRRCGPSKSCTVPINRIASVELDVLGQLFDDNRVE